MNVRTMEYHGPGWEIRKGERYYMLWGPNPTPGHDYRDHWAAAIATNNEHGTFATGADPETALKEAGITGAIAAALLSATRQD